MLLVDEVDCLQGRVLYSKPRIKAKNFRRTMNSSLVPLMVDSQNTVNVFSSTSKKERKPQGRLAMWRLHISRARLRNGTQSVSLRD